VQIRATGSWSCAPGGEMVDAAGYPNSERFFRYYMDPQRNPRLSQTAHYGALLARILTDGVYHPLSTEASFEADRSGELTLDINEAPSARRDNKGGVDVFVLIDP
jgi:hypothetical protein